MAITGAQSGLSSTVEALLGPIFDAFDQGEHQQAFDKIDELNIDINQGKFSEVTNPLIHLIHRIYTIYLIDQSPFEWLDECHSRIKRIHLMDPIRTASLYSKWVNHLGEIFTEELRSHTRETNKLALKKYPQAQPVLLSVYYQLSEAYKHQDSTLFSQKKEYDCLNRAFRWSLLMPKDNPSLMRSYLAMRLGDLLSLKIGSTEEGKETYVKLSTVIYEHAIQWARLEQQTSESLALKATIIHCSLQVLYLIRNEETNESNFLFEKHLKSLNDYYIDDSDNLLLSQKLELILVNLSHPENSQRLPFLVDDAIEAYGNLYLLGNKIHAMALLLKWKDVLIKASIYHDIKLDAELIEVRQELKSLMLSTASTLPNRAPTRAPSPSSQVDQPDPEIDGIQQGFQSLLWRSPSTSRCSTPAQSPSPNSLNRTSPVPRSTY